MENSLVDVLSWGVRQPGFLKCTPEEFFRICEEAGLDKIANDNISSFQGTLECSCLVLLHAELELALIELFHIVSIVAPKRILPDIPCERFHEQNSQGKLGSERRAFDRGLSLPRKVKKLYDLLDEAFDVESVEFKQLESFDEARHSAVHRPGSISVPDFETSQKTFRDWGLKCWALVLTKLGLKMDTDAVTAVMTGEATQRLESI